MSGANLTFRRSSRLSDLIRYGKDGERAEAKFAKLGCRFKDGARHTIVYYNEARTLIPRHPSKEIKTGTYNAILKKLGIKE